MYLMMWWLRTVILALLTRVVLATSSGIVAWVYSDTGEQSVETFDQKTFDSYLASQTATGRPSVMCSIVQRLLVTQSLAGYTIRHSLAITTGGGTTRKPLRKISPPHKRINATMKHNFMMRENCSLWVYALLLFEEIQKCSFWKYKNVVNIANPCQYCQSFLSLVMQFTSTYTY